MRTFTRHRTRRNRRRSTERPGRGIDIEITAADIIGDLVRLPFGERH